LYRKQVGGPARGYFQFEVAGVSGVLRHRATARYAEAACILQGVKPEPADVHAAIEHDDALAAAFARLLLYTDPDPLPKLGDTAGSWALYQRTWRPGRPRRDTWDAFYLESCREVASD
jgi:hypothetical protein